MMRHWKTIAKVAVAVLTALLGALGSAAATGVRLWAAPFWYNLKRFDILSYRMEAKGFLSFWIDINQMKG